MDVVLVQPRLWLNRNPSRRATLPKGLLAVATPLDLAGYRVKIVDQDTEPDWEQTLLDALASRPLCVGVTSMTGPQISWALRASKLVKLKSDIPVVWGGVHASLLPRQTLESPFVDAVVQGEGEETFLELVNALAAGRPLDQVRGVWYKENGQIRQNDARPLIDLGRQPPLSYHLVDLDKHMVSALGRDCLGFETSRGCPHSCAFCYNGSLRRKEWRGLSVDETLLRIRRLVRESGVRGLIFSDDNFFADPHRAYAILEEIVRQDLGIVWTAGDIRLDLLSQLDDDYLRLIVKSGCLSLVIGVESGSQKMVDIMRKGIDVSKAVEVNRRLAGYEIYPRYCFVVGVPGETQSDLAETTSLMLRLMNDNRKAAAGVNLYTPYPGTELLDRSLQHGLAMPGTLEEWIPFTWIRRRPDYPWLSPDMRKLLQMILFCSVFVAGDRNLRIFSDSSPLLSLAARVYSPVAKRKLRMLHYRFLPELRIAETLGYRGY